MARIRTVKPELAAHEGLFDLEVETGLPIRFSWCMLFTVADREGRFSWRPRTLKAQIIPFDDIDFSRVLDAWLSRGFVRKYRVGAEVFGWIPSFTRHQVINNRESASTIPPIEQADEDYQKLTNASTTREVNAVDASATREVHAQVEGKEGREGKDASETLTPSIPRKPKKTRLPEDFSLTPELEQYAVERLPSVNPPELLASFRGKAGAKGWEYVNWRQAFQEFVRNAMPNSGHFAAGQYPKKSSGDNGLWSRVS